MLVYKIILRSSHYQVYQVLINNTILAKQMIWLSHGVVAGTWGERHYRNTDSRVKVFTQL